eukprot:91920-Ditylum_brightwellii.AAC.2
MVDINDNYYPGEYLLDTIMLCNEDVASLSQGVIYRPFQKTPCASHSAVVTLMKAYLLTEITICQQQTTICQW